MEFKQKFTAILLLIFLSMNLTVVYANPTSVENPRSGDQNPEDINSSAKHGADDHEDEKKTLPTIEAEGSILMDIETGKILYGNNIDKQFYPASTTKILTALLAIENGDMEDIVTVSDEANLVHRDGTIAGLDLGEKISLENLVYGLMLPSGNDAAYTIAVYVARRVTDNPDMPIQEAIDYFSNMMNERAKAAGAKNSHFSNPHGYHADDHFTTPYDIAMIAREAMQYEFFRNIVSTCMYTMDDWNGVDKEDPTKKEIRYWKNTNLLIDKKNTKFYYPYATGIKTGYTSSAGQCLVSSAKKGPLDLIAVVYKSSKEGKWNDSIELFEYGFKNFIPYELVKKGEPLASTEILYPDNDEDSTIDLVAKEGYTDILKKADIDKIEPKIVIQPNIEAPVQKDQVIGQISYTLDGELLFKTDLVANKDIQKKSILNITTTDNDIDSTKASLNGHKTKETLIVFGVLALLLIFLYSVLRKKRKRRHMPYRGK